MSEVSVPQSSPRVEVARTTYKVDTEVGFTPGPWGQVGNRVGTQTESVCQCYADGDDWLPMFGRRKAVANARLISAAPELLEACRAMIAWDDAEKSARTDDGAFHERMNLCREAFDKARAAVAKAVPPALESEVRS